jgi:hypothetical protein
MRVLYRVRFIFLIGVIFFLGCALRHTEEIGKIQAYGRNIDEQKKYVAEQGKRFEELLVAVKAGEPLAYPTAQDVRARFGDPVFVKTFEHDETCRERWLYRYAEKLWDSDKVYICFDAQGKTLRWEYQSSRKSGK